MNQVKINGLPRFHKVVTAEVMKEGIEIGGKR
jgi:hypothetical protein